MNEGIEKYVTISRYAKLCGISRQAVNSRLEPDGIKAVFKKGFFGRVIDITKYPPVKKKKMGGGRKPKPKDTHRRPTKTVKP